jgi:hypothetical protein
VSSRSARDFVPAAFDAFTAALTTGEVHERSYHLAGDVVRVRYAGPVLPARFDRALAPFVVDPALPAAMTVACWEMRTTGTAPPPPPWTAQDLLPRHRIRGFDRDGVRATYDMEHRLLHLYEPGARAVCFAQDERRIPPWVARAPFRTLLSWWAVDRGLAVVHASAIGDDDACVLVTGPSESGKSTTALACVQRGLRFAGDDVSIVALEPAPTTFASSAIAKVEAGSPLDPEQLGGSIVSVSEHQTTVDLGAEMLTSAAVRAVIAVARGTDRATTVRRLGAGACFRALAGHSVVEALAGDPRALTLLRELACRVPAYEVTLGRDLDGVAAAVCSVLAGTS